MDITSGSALSLRVGLGDLDTILDSEVGLGESMVSVLGWVGNGAGSDLVKSVVESWELGRLSSSP